MGTSQSKKLGVKPQGTISSDDVRRMWRKFDKEGKGHMSVHDTKQFLRVFAKAVKTEYSEERADAVIEVLLKGDGTVNFESFRSLLAVEAEASGAMNLSESMQVLASSYEDGAPPSSTPVYDVGESVPDLQEFDALRFEQRVRRALAAARKVLDANRSPAQCGDVPHTYTDKYLLVEFLVNTAVAAFFNVLEALGASGTDLLKMREMAQQRDVTLRLCVADACKFSHEKKYKVESGRREREVKSGGTSLVKVVSRSETKVTDYYWKYTAEVVLEAVSGPLSKPAARVQLARTDVCTEIVTRDNTIPRPKSRHHDPLCVNVTWLLALLSPDLTVRFSVDREHEQCHTPRRNVHAESALRSFAALAHWSQGATDALRATLLSLPRDEEPEAAVMSWTGVFVPLAPLMERSPAQQMEPVPLSTVTVERRAEAADGAGAVHVLSVGDIHRFLAEQSRSLQEKFAALKAATKAVDKKRAVVTEGLGRLFMPVGHIHAIACALWDGVDSVEEMLRTQLCAAIGKEVTPNDFSEYMRFHNRRLFTAWARPRCFAYPVRRGEGSDPEGEVQISCAVDGGGAMRPATTMVRCVPAPRPIRMEVEGGVVLRCSGPQYVHAMVGHRFSQQAEPRFELSARARPFSSFVLLVGRVTAADAFTPSAALVVKNKDDVVLPLLMDMIPSAKAFKRATQSMSEEQQRFAKAYRSMQLESTLFALMVVHVKPQLEVVLGVPRRSLTKEIRLTQDLLNLFIEYNIPSDLVSFAGPEDTPGRERVAAVRRYVDEMKALIEKRKAGELEEEQEESAYRRVECDLSSESECDEGEGDWGGGWQRNAMEDCQLASMSFMAPSAECAPLEDECDFIMEESYMECAMPEPVREEMPAEPTPPEEVSAQGDEDARGEGEGEEGDGGEDGERYETGAGGEGRDGAVDLTALPARLDGKLEALDEGDAVRPTIIKVVEDWRRKRWASVLADGANEVLGEEEKRRERNEALDLLDGMTRSGAVGLQHTELHVVMASTHCFEHTLVDTIVQRSENPIETFERSQLITASVVHDSPVLPLLAPDHVERVQTYSPNLF
eukprot:TRINITY_DN2397_c0_g2_i1.p1 TRINITY_DN2397_c0_g2~~TRINITY_DN2397_c0_g2_i1.p1  ORF type:complete len:1085 (-),score=448.58 TRINITY_DN2397_c0_g2_i1:334-3534(-)